MNQRSIDKVLKAGFLVIRTAEVTTPKFGTEYMIGIQTNEIAYWHHLETFDSKDDMQLKVDQLLLDPKTIQV